MNSNFLGIHYKNDIQIRRGKILILNEEAIDLMVSLSATDANSEKKWRGFYNSLSQKALQGEWDEYWKS